MKILLLPEAAQEFEDAVVYLEEEEPGLGLRLRVEMDAHIGWIVENPTISRLEKAPIEGLTSKFSLITLPT